MIRRDERVCAGSARAFLAWSIEGSHPAPSQLQPLREARRDGLYRHETLGRAIPEGPGYLHTRRMGEYRRRDDAPGGGVPETTSSCKSFRLMCPPVHFVKLVRMSAIFLRVSPEGNGNFRNVSPVSLSCSMKVCRPVLVPVL